MEGTTNSGGEAASDAGASASPDMGGDPGASPTETGSDHGDHNAADQMSPDGLEDGNGGEETPNRPELPEGLVMGDDGQLYVEATERGETIRIPLEEFRKGHLRQRDYTKKAQELAEQRREAEQRMSEARAVFELQQRASRGDKSAAATLIEYYQHLGIDPRGFGETMLGYVLDEDQLSPEERAARDRERELQRREQELSEREKRAYQARLAEAQKQAEAELPGQIQGLISAVGLGPEAVGEDMFIHIQQEVVRELLDDQIVERGRDGIERVVDYHTNMTMEDAVRVVAERVSGTRSKSIDGLKARILENPALVEEIFGEEFVRAWNKHRLAQHQEQQANRVAAPARNTPPRAPDAPRMSTAELRRRLTGR